VIQDKYGNDVTPARWESVDLVIKGFIRTYPLHWLQFRKDMEANQTEYQLALEGDLKKSSFRNTLSFPIVARPRTQEEIDADPGHSPVEFVDSIKTTLDVLIPGFTDPDEPGKPNKLYKEFIRRYGRLFQPGEKY
jgi:hypothetical protein